jgi:hypothetical protein
MNVYLYVLCYGALIATYGFFAYVGKVPMDGFINILTAAIAALGAAHIAAPPQPPALPPATTKDAP